MPQPRTRPQPPARAGGDRARSGGRRGRTPTVRLLPGCPADQQVVVVDGGRVRLAFLPGVGGRLLGASVDGRELLWHNPRLFADDLTPLTSRADWPVPDGTLATWVNPGGSKVWPAPEGPGPGEWPGPPEAVLESGPWDLRRAVGAGADGAPTAVVTLTSAADPRTGLRVTRTFRLAAGALAFTEDVCLANVSDAPVTWSAWEVCQVATDPWRRGAVEGVVEVGQASPGRPVPRGPWVGALEAAPLAGGALAVPVGPVIGKAGFPGADGSVAYRGPDGAALRLATAVAPGAAYPNGSPVDVWFQVPSSLPLGPEFRSLHPRDRYVELEVLSPLVTIAPGGTARWGVAWGLTAATAGGAPRPRKDVT